MTEVSIAPGAVSTIGILHATLVGAVVSGTIFITCWFLSFAPVTATHSLISLFTTAEPTSLAALALGLCGSIIFGAWVGFLIPLAVWSRHLMVHYPCRNGRMHYGTDSTRQRPYDRGSPSSDTA